VLGQALLDLRAGGAPEVAAALAFYALVSLFPLLLAGAAIASFFVEPAWAVDRITDLLGEFLPRGEIEVEEIVTAALAERGRVGLISVVVLLVSGRRVLGALAGALNRVSDVDHRRGSFWRQVGVELAMLGGVGALFGLALSSGPLLGLLRGALGGDEAPADWVWGGALAVLRALLLLATFYVVYVYVPRGERSRRAALVGAAAATLLFLVARQLFLFWVDRLWGNFSLIYGPLAVGAVLLLWAWYVALITLFGGALASHVKVMVVEGRSAAEAARRHLDPPAAGQPAAQTAGSELPTVPAAGDAGDAVRDIACQLVGDEEPPPGDGRADHAPA